MLTSINRTHIFTLSIATSACLLASNLNVASAEIYKWRNERGVIQYSDKPPISGFTKVNRNELVNALQAKDLCAEPTAKTAATASNRKLSANFFGIGGEGGINNSASSFPVIAATTPKPAVVVIATAPKPIPVATAPKPVVVTTPKPILTPTPVVTTPKPVPVTSPSNAALLQQYKSTGLINGMTVAAWAALSPANAALVQQYKNTGSIDGVTASPVPAASPAPTVVATAPTTSIPTPSIPNIIQSALLPAVDISKNMTPAVGFNVLRVQTTNEQPSQSGGEGAFRIECGYSHMSNDDPIIYPNQQGAAHHHTFFGNTSANFKTNPATLSTTGNSTCSGGVMNRSAYWVPTIIDTATNAPIKANRMLVYYKTTNPGKVVQPPKGLRMIAGNAKATSPQDGIVRFTCNEDYNSRKPHIPACNAGGTMEELLYFPQCWDGKNLDSPDHKSHMAYKEGNSCPASHPVMIPDITYNVYYSVGASGTSKWRLASDNYAGGSGGNSFHGDWMNGWDESFSKIFTDNCLKKGLDCHAHLLGNGQMYY